MNTPQNISSNLDPRIFPTVTTAMAALVHPTINATIAAAIPDVIRTINAATPQATVDARGCLHAALWLLADDLPQAHILCQDIPTALGSAWHAHLHRREGDFSNSKYWWRRAEGLTWKAPAQLPLHTQLSALLEPAPRELATWKTDLRTRYDPTQFVDLVERHHQSASPQLEQILADIQRLEWTTLFLQCFQAAGGM